MKVLLLLLRPAKRNELSGAVTEPARTPRRFARSHRCQRFLEIMKVTRFDTKELISPGGGRNGPVCLGFFSQLP